MPNEHPEWAKRMMKPLPILSVESLLETTIITNCFGPSVYGQAGNSGQRASLVILDRREESWQNVGVAIPEGCGVRAREDEKVEKYQDLAREV